MGAERLPYDDPDTAHEMAVNASACRQERHLAARAVDVAQTAVDKAPAALLTGTRKVVRTAVSVTDSAAKFATKLFD